jgi:D-xylose 1-dehydrogenase (NADP+, D-xylono-1,5-lactone-forming)
MDKVRWGLLSTARINRLLIPDIRSSGRSELAAIASRSLDKAQAYAKKWDIPHAFGSYQEMLDSGVIDVVYISLPNHLHAVWTIKALEAGVNVLCEKPFAISMQEVDDMIQASHLSGKVLAEAFMYRHHPQTKILGDLIHQGNLGEISHFWGTFCFLEEDRSDIRLVKDWGGGALWDIGVYPMSLAQFVFGEAPVTVSGSQWTGDTGVDETFVGQMRYSGDGYAQISCSFRTQQQTAAEIIGTEGRFTISRPFIQMDSRARRLMFYPNKGRPVELKVPSTPLYLGEIEDMNAAILDGTPTFVSLDETRNHVRTILALYDSARKGKPVELAKVK